MGEIMGKPAENGTRDTKQFNEGSNRKA